MMVCCDVCESGCQKCAKALSTTCEACCPEDRPSPLFTIFSVAINIALLIVSAVAMGNDSGKTCSTGGACTAWHSCCIVIAILNVAFAYYAYHKFKEALEKGERACSSASRFIFYDLGCYAYMFVLIWIIVWLAVAATMCDSDEETVCTSQTSNAAGIVLLACYLGVGAFAFAMSTCVQCCTEDPEKAKERMKQEQQSQHQQQQQQQQQGQRAVGTSSSAAPSAAAVTPQVMGTSRHQNYQHQNQQQQQQHNRQRRQEEGEEEEETRTSLSLAAAAAATVASLAGSALKSIGNSLSSNKEETRQQEQQQQQNRNNHQQQQQQQNQNTQQQERFSPPAQQQQPQQQQPVVGVVVNDSSSSSQPQVKQQNYNQPQW